VRLCNDPGAKRPGPLPHRCPWTAGRALAAAGSLRTHCLRARL